MNTKIGNLIGEIIASDRQKKNLTQDQYGKMFGISGPAVFKFEKGYVKPSLELWHKMAAEACIERSRATRIWVISKLPEEYCNDIELTPVNHFGAPPAKAAIAKLNVVDFPGLNELLGDPLFIAAFFPEAGEIQAAMLALKTIGNPNADHKAVGGLLYAIRAATRS